MTPNEFVRDHAVAQIMAHAEVRRRLAMLGWRATVDLGDGDTLQTYGLTRQQALDALAVRVAAWLDEDET